MKIRRFAAAAMAATAITAGATVPAQAQTYPEPLNQVMHELRKIGGPQGPNALLVPAALSAVGLIPTIINALVIANVISLGVLANSSQR